MKSSSNLFLVLFMVFATIAFCSSNVKAVGNEVSQGTAHDLALSDMHIKVTSQGHTATFQLYDTVAAKEFFAQLPLELELENFRNAQWMFYPPKKLGVTSREAYHEGKKGELSYYAPWGDAFMLYKDFYAGDEMHRLGIGISGINDIAMMSGSAKIVKIAPRRERAK